MQQRVMTKVLSFIEPLLTAILGRYIEGDIASCLLFHRWGIEFKSENVSLKAGALDQLGLPISVKKGFLKLLHITITYTFHIQVNVNGLFLLIYPQHSRQHFDTKSSHRQKNAIKKSSLDRAEQRMLETEWKFLSKSMSYGEAFVRGLGKHLATNIKLDISDVHIRYQDITTIPDNSFIFGITIKKIWVKNKEEKIPDTEQKNEDIDDDTDNYMNRKASNFLDNYLMERLDFSSSDDDDDVVENADDVLDDGVLDQSSKDVEEQSDNDSDGKRQKTDTNDGFDAELDKKVITKEIVMESMSIYNDIMQNKDAGKQNKDIIWREDVLSDDELRAKFEFIPSRQLRISSYDYILKPMGISFSVYLHENFRGYIEKYPYEPLKWRPNIECDINLDVVDIFISTKQIFALQTWSKHWDFIQKKMKYHELIEEMKSKRPECGLNGVEDKRIWWQYLIACALKKNRCSKYGENEFKVENIINFEHRKATYICLYKRKMRPHKYRYWLTALTNEERDELYQLEVTFPHSQILIFRCLAIAELKKQMKKRDEYQAALQRQKAEQQKNSYMLTKLFSVATSLITAPREAEDGYKLSDVQVREVMNETDFIKQIDEQMKYPDNYIMCHFGLFLDEANVQLADEGNNIALVQIGIGTQFDIRSHSYLSQIGINKMDLCLGSKRDLKHKSLFQPLLTPINVQIDIETDSIDINKNNVKVHNIGNIELLLNPEIITSNALKIDKLVKDITKIIKKRIKENKQMWDVVAIEEEEEKKEKNENVNIINMDDILMVKSNDMNSKYFVSLQYIHKSCNLKETTIAGYWVILQSENNNSDQYVFGKNKNNNNIAVIKLKNVLRNVDDKYMTIQTRHMQNEGNTNMVQWIVSDKQQFVHYLQQMEKSKLGIEVYIENIDLLE